MLRSAPSLLDRLPLARWLSPLAFARLAARLVPHFAVAAILLVAAAFGVSLWSVPAPERAGNLWPLVFLHAPAGWMSLFLYLLMTGWAALSLGVRARLPALMMVSLAPTGAMFSAVSLLSGLLLRAPQPGWWGWDATLGTQGLLLLLFIAVAVLRRALPGPRSIRVQATLVLIGALNLPIIYLALRWWCAQQPGTTLGSPRGLASTMLAASLLLALAFWTYANAVILSRAQRLIGQFDACAPQEARLEDA